MGKINKYPPEFFYSLQTDGEGCIIADTKKGEMVFGPYQNGRSMNKDIKRITDGWKKSPKESKLQKFIERLWRYGYKITRKRPSTHWM